MIQTNRLIIRPFVRSDVTEAFTWFSNDEVMKYIPNGADKLIDDTQRRIDKYIDYYTKYGYSKYAIIETDSGKLIGDCGILKIEDSELKELGFRISRNNWNKGYATEAAFAVLKYAFEVLNFNEVYAIVENENIASLHMIKDKLGFYFLKNIYCYNTDMLLFALEKQNFINGSFYMKAAYQIKFSGFNI